MNRRRAGSLALLVAVTFAAISWSQPPGGAGGRRRLSVSAAGFEPQTVRARAGEPIRLSIVAADREHCFSVPSLGIEKRLRRGRPLEVELGFEKPGTYPFSCCLESGRPPETGQVVVTE